MLADKFVGTDNDGKVTNKAETIADTKATKFESATYEDVEVTAFGDMAVATGSFRAKGADSSGKTFDYQERFTDTWVKCQTANGNVWPATNQSLLET